MRTVHVASPETPDLAARTSARTGASRSRPPTLASRVARLGQIAAHAATLTPTRVFLVLVIASAYFISRGISWNADTHLYLTTSIVDRGTLNIDPFASRTGDIAFVHGHFYADKAPGLSLLAVPVYLLLKLSLLHGQTYASLLVAPPAQQSGFLLRWFLALVFATLPTGALAVLLIGMMRRMGVTARWSGALALVYGLGTIARPFAAQFFSHQLAAAFIFGAFVVLFRVRHGELPARATVLAGLLAGAAVATEYPTALLALALGLYAVTGTPWRATLVRLALGALPPALVCAAYNTLAFGGPLSLGYARLAGPVQFRVGQAQGVYGVTVPHLTALWQTTIGPYRGVFFWSPVLLLAIPGGFMLLRRRLEWRPEAVLWIACVVLYGLFSVSYFAWDGGYSMGPRQFLPALPFLLLLVAEVVRPCRRRIWRVTAAVLGCISVVLVELATSVDALVSPQFASPLTDWVAPRLAGMTPDPAHPGISAARLLTVLAHAAPFFTTAKLDNNWGMLAGLPGALQLLPLGIAVVMVLLWPAHSRVLPNPPTTPAA